MSSSTTKMPNFQLIQIGPGLWNARSPFKVLAGFVDVGTHMAVVQMPNGRFVLIDAVELRPELANQLDRLTANGRLIDAVIATHPFHTVFLPGLHQRYPWVPFFGCPRHLRRLRTIPWAGSLLDPCVRRYWEPELFMRIPAGAEFVNPLPEDSNHFSNVFVYHPRSRTVYNNDTILIISNPGLLMQIAGASHGSMSFHPSLKGPALLEHPDAPAQFYNWVQALCRDWDFDNILSAHNSNKIGGAKAQLLDTLRAAKPLLLRLEKQRRRRAMGRYPTPAPVPLDNQYNAVACG